MRILAADDEILQLKKLERAIAEAVPGAETVSFSQPSKLLEWVEGGGGADVAFLDVEMGSMTGIEVAKRILAAKPQTNVVFVTGFLEYALDAFKIHASGYLTKPVTADKIRKEMENLRFGVSRLFIRTFGDFDVFADGVAISFPRAKSKELLAYLVWKRGGMATRKEVSAILFEDEYTQKTQNYLVHIYSDLVKTLQKYGVDNILIKGYNQYAVDTNLFSCDLYDYDAGDPAAVSAYKGDFMSQYEWAVF